MQSRLKQVKAITGAHAAKAKHNLFAMARIKAHLLPQWNTKQQKLKQFISADVRKQLSSRCVTEAIVNRKALSKRWL